MIGVTPKTTAVKNIIGEQITKIIYSWAVQTVLSERNHQQLKIKQHLSIFFFIHSHTHSYSLGNKELWRLVPLARNLWTWTWTQNSFLFSKKNLSLGKIHTLDHPDNLFHCLRPGSLTPVPEMDPRIYSSSHHIIITSSFIDSVKALRHLRYS